VALVDEPLDQLMDLGDHAGGARLVGGRQDAELRVGGVEQLFVGVGQRPERKFFRRGLHQHLVVDIGDVPDERDLVTGVQQPAPEHVVVHPGAEMADMRPGLHGDPTEVHAYLAGNARREVAHRSGRGVVKPQGHAI
jgi:hypothetical protein